MARYFHPLLALIASATDRELAKYVEYLKYENKILRARLPQQIHTTTEERNTLLKYGKAVGKAISQLITIVSPATFTRWLRDDAIEKPVTKKLKGGQQTKSRKAKPAVLIHDRDVKYTARFKKLLEKNGLKPSPLPITSPNLNGRCEKFIGTIKLECLSRFIVFGKKHLDHLVASFTDYYNHHRSHSSRNHLPPVGEAPSEVASLAVNEVVVRSHVGGLIKSFERKAA